MALNLGTRSQPIHIDCSPDDWNHTEAAEAPGPSVASTSLSPPQQPLTTHVLINSQVKSRKTPLAKGKSVLSPFVTPRVRNDTHIGEPMTAHSQDVVKTLKRNRSDPKEVPDPEQAKRFKKSEKKRHKWERRTARIAQLDNKVSSLHPPNIPLNFDPISGPSHWSPAVSSRRSLLQDAPLATAIPRRGHSTPDSPSTISSHGSYDCHQDQIEITPRRETNEQDLFSPSPNSEIVLPLSVPVASVHDPLPSRLGEGTPDNMTQGKSILVNQVAPDINTMIPHSVSTSSSVLNRRIKERMAFLIEHQRLANGADNLPLAPLHRTPNPTPSKVVVGDTISTKQNILDEAISENKAALAQLGAPLSKELKLTLMKTVTERNKLITQLTNEIKIHLDTLRSIMVTEPVLSPLDNLAARFKWPETKLPLYLIIANDDEDSYSRS